MAFDFSSALQGAGGGAGIGSMFGPIGTGIGAGAGFLGGGFFGGGKKKQQQQDGQPGSSNFMMGNQGSFQALPTMSPEQQGLYQQLLSGLGGQGGPLQMALQNLQGQMSGDSSAFEAPAMRQFYEQIIPGIKEQFTGMGAGAQSSSAFQQTLGQAGAGLAERLAMHKAESQQQALGPLLSLFGMGTQTPTFNWQQTPEQPGFLQPLLQGLGSAAGEVGTNLATKYLSKKFGLTGG